MFLFRYWIHNQKYQGNSLCVLKFFKERDMRGDHYHKNKVEYFYLMTGNLIGYFWGLLIIFRGRFPPSLFFISPGLKFTKSSFILEVLLQFPVWQDQEGSQLEQGTRLIVGTRFMF